MTCFYIVEEMEKGVDIEWREKLVGNILRRGGNGNQEDTYIHTIRPLFALFLAIIFFVLT